MKTQLANLVAYAVVAGLFATGFSAPLVGDSAATPVRSDDEPASQGSVSQIYAKPFGENLDFYDPTNPTVVRVLDDTRSSLALSAIQLERRNGPLKKTPVKAPSGRKPLKAPSDKKPARNPSDRKLAKPPSDRKPAKSPTKKKPTLDLEFTKYPKKKQHWSPPKGKKPVTKRQSEPPAVTQHAKSLTLQRRASFEAKEGTTEIGKAADKLTTWSVSNCIAIAGYDNTSGAKAMAHINGVTIHGKEYGDQFKDFANVVYSWRGPIEIWVRWPDRNVIPSDRGDLREEQDEFENTIKRYLSYMKNDPTFRVFEVQARRHKGDMIMFPEGDVAVDT